MIGKVRLYRSGGYDPSLGRAVIDPTLEPKGKASLLPGANTDNPEHLCQRCRKIASKEERNG